MVLPRSVVDRIQLKLQQEEELRQRQTPQDLRWLAAFDAVRRTLDETDLQLMQLHLKEEKSLSDVMELLFLEKSAVYRRREDLLCRLALAAAEMGAIRVYAD